MSTEKGENFYDKNSPDQRFESKPEQPSEKIELSNKEFLGMLTSERFLEVIKKAGEETKKDGRETGFNMLVFEDKSFLIPGIKRGSTDRMAATVEEFIEGGRPDQQILSKKYSNIDFHFHPTEGAAVAPSGSDLFLFTLQVSLFGVCQIEKNDEIRILLVRTKNYIHPSEIPSNAGNYEDELDKHWHTDVIARNVGQKIVIEALNDNGFEAFLISFLRAKGKYKLTDESKNTLSRISNLKLNLS